MINFNENILSKSQTHLMCDNRAYRYGDGLFETIKVVDNKIQFWEDHYFRLMASMRILRMEIPMSFTMEFLEEEILKTIQSNHLDANAARVRLSVFRGNGGTYLPLSNNIEYIIEVAKLESKYYGAIHFDKKKYVVDLYKDHYINAGMLSTLKSNNKIEYVLASIYAQENDLDNCLLLNNDKNVIEATNGNLFLVSGNIIKTAPLSSGCLKGIMRKQIIEMVKKHPEFTLDESNISSFELQKADELFISNAIAGIIPISKYRKKDYGFQISKELCGLLNQMI